MTSFDLGFFVHFFGNLWVFLSSIKLTFFRLHAKLLKLVIILSDKRVVKIPNLKVISLVISV